MLISKFDTTNIAEKIADLQCQYGTELPGQYRQFLHKYNGTMVVKRLKLLSDLLVFPLI